MDTAVLRLKINDIPPDIKSWLGSEEVIRHIENINHRFNIVGENERVIPKLILYLAVHVLEPQYFSGEIANQLKIDRDKARLITEQVKALIFSRTRRELKSYGVDIDLLDKFEMPHTSVFEPSFTPVIERTELPSSVPPPFTTAEIGESKKIGVTPPVPVPPTPMTSQEPETPSEGPVIIHKEIEFQPTTGVKSSSFGGMLGLGRPEGKKEEIEVPAQIEMGDQMKKPSIFEAPGAPTEPIIARTEIPKPKVVHYSQFQTPLSPFEKREISSESEIEIPGPPLPPELAGVPKPPKPIEAKPETANEEIITPEIIMEAKPEVKSVDLKLSEVKPETLREIIPPPTIKKESEAPKSGSFGVIDLTEINPLAGGEISEPPKPAEIKPKKEESPRKSAETNDEVIDLRTFKKIN